jgi:hypothetical protein
MSGLHRTEHRGRHPFLGDVSLCEAGNTAIHFAASCSDAVMQL